MKALPPTAYFKLFDAMSGLTNPARRGGLKRSVEPVDGVFRITWSDGTIFHFSHPNRYGRYAWPEGLAHISEFLLDKYQDKDVRLHPGDIVVEAGANVGEFTCAAARIASFVYAFDPDNNVQPALFRNASRHPNVEVVPAGLGEKSEKTTFFTSTENADSSIIQPDTFTDKITIDVTTIADFMREKALPRIDFLKVEAEGYEPEILKGIGPRLSDISRIAIDCSPERGGESPFEECEAVLHPAGFETWRRDARGEVPPMLFATRR